MAWYFLNLFKKPFLIKRMHTIGTKNVVKKVKKVAEGKVCYFILIYTDINYFFFCLLERSTKVHLYYCMKNCGRSPDRLREMILKIVKHYQVQFTRKYIPFF